MRLAVGSRTYDLATRALVVGIASTHLPNGRGHVTAETVAALVGSARRLVGEGADAVDLVVDREGDMTAAVGDVVASLDVPVCVTVPTAESARSAIDGGAALVRPEPALAPEALAGVIGPAPIGVVLVPPYGAHPGSRWNKACARSWEDAGVPPERIVVETGVPTADLSAASGAQGITRLAALGYPLQMSAPAGASTDSIRAAIALGVVDGCRLVRTTEVRIARRVVDTLAAVMEAGEESTA